ncbi:MAG TPA: hypothetical protein VGV86_11110 [Acidimicrobiales bacterium]|nr:hypothetical protein [Acidimicrobiales bacterium]
MIDLDRMEAQLAAALSTPVRPSPAAARTAPVPAPTPAPAPAPASRRRPRVVAQAAPAPEPRRRSRPRAETLPASAPELLELGLLEDADAVVVGGGAHPRDELSWTTMRALLEGRHDAARRGIEELSRLAQRTEDAEAWDPYWVQRFWFAFEWGTEEERYDVLDHCRERAYRFDDLPWWGNLTLLLAATGKHEEARRAFDATQELVLRAATDACLLDVVTNLVEAAALMGDAGRVAAAARILRWPEGRLVVVGAAVVCKGSVDRYVALAHLALGDSTRAGECFRRAEATNRAIGAGPMLARTLQQASSGLVAA